MKPKVLIRNCRRNSWKNGKIELNTLRSQQPVVISPEIRTELGANYFLPDLYLFCHREVKLFSNAFSKDSKEFSVPLRIFFN
jgi:hypothetical protein